MKRTLALLAMSLGLVALAAANAEPPTMHRMTPQTMKPQLMNPPVLARVVAQVAVHPETTYQTVTGFGSGFTGATEALLKQIKSDQDRAKAYDLLYGTSGAELNIVRFTVSPLAQPIPAITNIGYDWAHNEETQAEWRAFQPILHPAPAPGMYILRRIKPILYAVPFSPPAQWKDNNSLIHGSLRPEYYQAYAQYLVSFLAYWHSLGADIDVISVQNEPGIAAPWASCLWTGDQMRDFVKILAPMIQARGLHTKIMLSEGTNWSGAWMHLKPALDDPAGAPLVDVMASHSYQLVASDPYADPGRALFKQAWEQTHKPVWMSEMSLMQPPQNDDPSILAGLRIAHYIHLDMTEARASAWIYCFAIFVTYPPGTTQQLGSMGVLSPSDLDGKLHVPKRLWAMANYSRFARPGWKLMEVDGSFDNTGFVSPDGNSFAVVAVNPNTTPLAARYDFANRTIGNLKAYVTDDTRDLAPAAAPSAGAHDFAATLPPRSVTTFSGSFLP